jgi:hypothetical protein
VAGFAYQPLVAAVPTWFWTVLIVGGFFVLSALTMVATRIPTRYRPPPVTPLSAEPPEQEEQSNG